MANSMMEVLNSYAKENDVLDFRDD
jgi:hypothetical protein